VENFLKTWGCVNNCIKQEWKITWCGVDKDKTKYTSSFEMTHHTTRKCQIKCCTSACHEHETWTVKDCHLFQAQSALFKKWLRLMLRNLRSNTGNTLLLQPHKIRWSTRMTLQKPLVVSLKLSTLLYREFIRSTQNL
jgi:hypothetical protein